MRQGPMAVVVLGFAIFCIGGLARGYMDWQLRSHNRYRGWKANTEKSYLRMAKEKGLGRLPLIIATVCIPVGIILVFGAIIYNNKTRLS